ncbi:HNH endonuclease [Novipirellula artificiosorum]|uniref:HNH endonuclease n=1 Tax=Novipirellula artificiosorum TaxID=2528016 RepID=UPI0036F44133
MCSCRSATAGSRDFFSCCAYCQTAESLTVTTFEIEHIVPISIGGSTEYQNLCLACPACNRFKSNRTRGITDAGHEADLFHPQRENWLEHFDWSVDGTVVVGLTEVAEATIRTLRINGPQVVEVRSLWVDAGRHPPK